MAAGDHMPQLSTTGFELPIGASKSVNLPSPWSGRIWGRTGCSNDSGIFVCVTGDCGSDQVECNGAGASLPTTLVELKTASKRGQDLYYVSNVNGFNLPMSIAPKGGLGVCNSSSCPADVTSECPEELLVRWSDGRVIACKSACLALNTTDKCQPTPNSQIFEEMCPDAYGYAYDNVRLNGSFTCSGGPNYTITFCPYFHRKPGTQSAKITFTNKCPYTVWPGTITGDPKPQLSLTSFELATGASKSLDVPSRWSGRFWGRTGCSSNSGKLTCATDYCGTGQMSCNVKGGATLATTLAELYVAYNGGQDYYDISIVEGFNLPMSITPKGGTGDCKQSSCPTDINAACPADLQVKGSDGKVIACTDACLAFNQPQYCCTGDFSTPEKCPPTNYSKFFSNQCPRASSHVYDDKTFTCFGNPDYVITFCP